MNLSPAFFDLQLRFADSIARVSHLSFEEALINFTNLHIRLIRRSFDPAHPIWRAYFEGLHRTSERTMWTYDFYQHRREPIEPLPYGCFRYDHFPEENMIRTHFANVDSSGSGPLSKEKMSIRLHELKRMFAEIKKRHGDGPRVRGVSWLYNLDAYRRLFPAQHTHDMKVIAGEFQYISLWGQFLRRDGHVHEHLANSFLACLQKAEILKDLTGCFPYQVLSPESSIALFYEFYEIKALE